MSLNELRKSRNLHEARRVRADRKYKAAKSGSASAKYWLYKRQREARAVAHRQSQIKAKLRKGGRARVVAAAQLCARNYRRNPGAYHYLAGGVPNTIIDRPTPRNYRSDCSQFAVNVYRMAGLPCPGSGSFAASNTISIAHGGRVTTRPRPGDLALYGSRWNPHHVEVYIGSGRFIGHGTQPIDGRVPGMPSFYLSFINE